MIERVVGISFNPTDNPEIKKGTEVEIFHNPNNEYSSRAIAVMYEGQLLGHIGEKDNPKHEEIFDALPLTAKVHTISRLGEGEEFAKFKVGEITHLEVEFPMLSDTEGQEASFNENVMLTFIRDGHRYVHNGKDLVSATTYIKRWIQGFDRERISAVYAKKYGYSQEEVLDLWREGGRVSATFGNAIHNALEHYEKYKKLGETIQAQKQENFNKALPTHPVLRDIVLEFTRNFTHKDDVVVPEAILTNVARGLCGTADRLLITGEKKCRVQDYKVNVDADMEDEHIKFLGQMATLPKTKLSKYQLQMSFYARLLELSGWTVEGLDAFVYEDKWKHFELPIIKLDF